MKKTFWLFLWLFSLPTLAAEITVSAAASLHDAFTAIVKAYQAENPTEKVHLNFAGSGALLQQILHGAPVDVFASADVLRMDKAEEANLLLPHSRHHFAENALVAIVPVSNQETYTDLDAFVTGKTTTQLAIANPEHVPAGRYSKNALENLNLWDAAQKKMIPTQNVRQALDYVARGEVAGGFVYQTDAAIMADKVRVVFPVPVQETLTYPIAVLKNTSQPVAAAKFVDFVRSETGQNILQQYGFLPSNH